MASANASTALALRPELAGAISQSMTRPDPEVYRAQILAQLRDSKYNSDATEIAGWADEMLVKTGGKSLAGALEGKKVDGDAIVSILPDSFIEACAKEAGISTTEANKALTAQFGKLAAVLQSAVEESISVTASQGQGDAADPASRGVGRAKTMGPGQDLDDVQFQDPTEIATKSLESMNLGGDKKTVGLSVLPQLQHVQQLALEASVVSVTDTEEANKVIDSFEKCVVRFLDDLEKEADDDEEEDEDQDENAASENDRGIIAVANFLVIKSQMFALAKSQSGSLGEDQIIPANKAISSVFVATSSLACGSDHTGMVESLKGAFNFGGVAQTTPELKTPTEIRKMLESAVALARGVVETEADFMEELAEKTD